MTGGQAGDLAHPVKSPAMHLPHLVAVAVKMACVTFVTASGCHLNPD